MPTSGAQTSNEARKSSAALEKLQNIITRHTPRVNPSAREGISTVTADIKYISAAIQKSKSHQTRFKQDAAYKKERASGITSQAKDLNNHSRKCSTESRIAQFNLEVAETDRLLSELMADNNFTDTSTARSLFLTNKNLKSSCQDKEHVSVADLNLAIKTRDKTFKLLNEISTQKIQLANQNAAFLKNRKTIASLRDKEDSVAKWQQSQLQRRAFSKIATSMNYNVQAFAAKLNKLSHASSLYKNTCTQTNKSLSFVKKILELVSAIVKDERPQSHSDIKARVDALNVMIKNHKKNIQLSKESKAHHAIHGTKEFELLTSDMNDAIDLEKDALNLAISVLSQVEREESHAQENLSISPFEHASGEMLVIPSQQMAQGDNTGLEIIPMS